MILYFYTYTDDAWATDCIGYGSFDIYSVLDKAEECPYPWKIKSVVVNNLAEAKEVPLEEIDKQLKIREILTKIFK